MLLYSQKKSRLKALCQNEYYQNNNLITSLKSFIATICQLVLLLINHSDSQNSKEVF